MKLKHNKPKSQVDFLTDIMWFKGIFLKYLKKAKNDKHSYSDFFGSAFRLDERTITTFKCIQDVKLQGALWLDSKPIEGLVNRRVLNMRKGQTAWVRDDIDEPHVTLENKLGVVNIQRDKWHADFRRFFV
jgi:hypothetical protein